MLILLPISDAITSMIPNLFQGMPKIEPNSELQYLVEVATSLDLCALLQPYLLFWLTGYD